MASVIGACLNGADLSKALGLEVISFWIVSHKNIGLSSLPTLLNQCKIESLA